jgi:LmbE family N-acetylglucosaminyl deacetylase
MATDDPLSPEPSAVSTEWILRSGGRPLFVFAHQDDETVLAGIIARIIGDDERGAFVWWTNGDGLAPEAGVDPVDYAEGRIAEASEALRRLGGSEKRKTDLACSEIETYRRLTHVALGRAVRRDALSYFRAEADKVETAIRDADPDRVFVLAWQGGHPEHDLTHVMTARAVRRLRAETGRPIPIIQCPAYEYVILCSLRFNPWFGGDRRHILLSDGEVEKKRSVFAAYPSQEALFRSFERVIRVAGAINRLRGRALSPEQYVAKEEFGVVEPAFDYTRSAHRLERLNYMFDHFQGTPIRFNTMVRPVAAALLDSNIAEQP